LTEAGYQEIYASAKPMDPSTKVHFTGLVSYFKNRSSFVKVSKESSTIPNRRRFGFNCLFVCCKYLKKPGVTKSDGFYRPAGPIALNHTLKMVVIWQGFKGPYARQVTDNALYPYISCKSVYPPGFFLN
jgi:hypothetical protein